MAYSLKLRGLSKAERGAKVSEAAELLELRECPDRKPEAMTMGHRVAGRRWRPHTAEAHLFNAGAGLRLNA